MIAKSGTIGSMVYSIIGESADCVDLVVTGKRVATQEYSNITLEFALRLVDRITNETIKGRY